MKRLTKKEEIIMNLYWENGPMFVRELHDIYPEPKPHFNTLSTQVRTLESNGYLKHDTIGAYFRYKPAIDREQFSSLSLDTLIDKCFGKSYMNAVSSLVRDEKITVDELKQLIDQIQQEK